MGRLDELLEERLVLGREGDVRRILARRAVCLLICLFVPTGVHSPTGQRKFPKRITINNQ